MMVTSRCQCREEAGGVRQVVLVSVVVVVIIEKSDERVLTGIGCRCRSGTNVIGDGDE